MTIWIDPPRWPGHDRLWSHLISDHDEAELHAFAAGLGLIRRGFDADHYDLPQERFHDAVAAGARPVSGVELLQRLRDSGLRVPKRKSERLVWWRPVGGGRLEVLRSPHLVVTKRVWVLNDGRVLGGQDIAGPHVIGHRRWRGPGEQCVLDLVRVDAAGDASAVQGTMPEWLRVLMDMASVRPAV